MTVVNKIRTLHFYINLTHYAVSSPVQGQTFSHEVCFLHYLILHTDFYNSAQGMNIFKPFFY